MADPAVPVARRTGWTPGQVWTAALSGGAAVALFVGLLPAARHPRAPAGAPAVGLTVGSAAAPAAPGAAGATQPVPAGTDVPASPAPRAAGAVAPAGADPLAVPPGAADPVSPASSPDGAAGGAAPAPSSAGGLPVAPRARTPRGTVTVPTPVPAGSRPVPLPTTRVPARPAPVTPTPVTPPPATPAPPAPAPASGGDTLGAALTVTGAGWTAPAGAPGVPAAAAGDGELPVGAAAGTPTSRGFLRLAGGGSVLHLPSTTSDPTGGLLAGTLSTAAIVLCANTSADWVPGPAQATGPPYDEDRCVTGTPSTDLSDWAFDLGALPPASRTSASGFTVVRDPSTPGRTFQVVFAPGSAA